MYAYTHFLLHSPTHTYVHAQLRMFTTSHAGTKPVHKQMHSCTCTNARTRAHTCTHSHVHTYEQMHRYTLTTLMNKHTHRTHTLSAHTRAHAVNATYARAHM